MPRLRLALIGAVSAVSVLVLGTGCEALSTALNTPAAATPETAPAPPAPPTAPAPPAGAAAPPSPAELAQSPASAAQPGSPAGQAAAPAAPVAQQASAHDNVIRVYRDWRPSVVTVISTVVSPDFRAKPEGTGSGSGFMLDDQGHILTNNHVVADATRLEITLANGTTLPAELIGRDPRFDIAVIKANIPADQVRVMNLADSDAVLVGEQVIAIGNPYGLEGTVTAGIVSGRRPVVNEPSGDGVLVNAIQTDASINPGNSGGPLLNARGEVIGVNTLGLMPNRAQAGLNFAIPINNAKRVLPDLLTQGTYAHPFVGIASAEITPQIASALGLSVQEGLLIQSVEPGTGAERAGLRGGREPQEVGSRRLAVGGDVVIAIDGQKVRRPEDFIAYLELNKKANENVTLTIVRDGQQIDVQVTLGQRPRSQFPSPR